MAQISIIVPVYNTEKFLKQCLDSLCMQTLQDLEFIVIDDGSTDRSGTICEEYAAHDTRIKVYHTDNHGLSMARNLGLDIARKNGSNYVGFVDSDDWVEPDMYEVLYDAAIMYRADIVECGIYEEKLNSSSIWYFPKSCICDSEENYTEIWKSYKSNVWNKLWRISCFDGIQFPPGRYYEDAAIILPLIKNSQRYCRIHEIKYHYRRSTNSISKQKSVKLLVDCWISQRDNLQFIKKILPGTIDNESLKQLEENQQILVISIIGKNWAWLITNPREEQKRFAPQFREMRDYIRENTPLFGKTRWPNYLRICSLLCRWDNMVSFFIAWILNQGVQLFHKDALY